MKKDLTLRQINSQQFVHAKKYKRGVIHEDITNAPIEISLEGSTNIPIVIDNCHFIHGSTGKEIIFTFRSCSSLTIGVKLLNGQEKEFTVTPAVTGFSRLCILTHQSQWREAQKNLFLDTLLNVPIERTIPIIKLLNTLQEIYLYRLGREIEQVSNEKETSLSWFFYVLLYNHFYSNDSKQLPTYVAFDTVWKIVAEIFRKLLLKRGYKLFKDSKLTGPIPNEEIQKYLETHVCLSGLVYINFEFNEKEEIKSYLNLIYKVGENCYKKEKVLKWETLKIPKELEIKTIKPQICEFEKKEKNNHVL